MIYILSVIETLSPLGHTDLLWSVSMTPSTNALYGGGEVHLGLKKFNEYHKGRYSWIVGLR